jgi:hypothetical protein
MALNESLATNTIRIAKTLRGVAPDVQDEIAQRAYLKMSHELLGPLLFTLVKNVAVQFYQEHGGALAEDLNDGLGRRILGIARVIAQDLEDAEEIAVRAHGRLRELIEGPYLRTVVRNEANTILGSDRSTVALVDAESVADAPNGESPTPDGAIIAPSHRARPEEIPPKRVIEERLRLVFGADASPSYEAIGYGYNVHLGRQPASIVAELATITVSDLAASLIAQYSEASGLPRAYVRTLCGGLARLQASPDGGRKLPEYWDPLLVVAGWVADVAQHVPESGADGCPIPESTVAVKKPPHRRLGYLFACHLGHQPPKIVAELGPRTLEELAVKFETRYANDNGWDRTRLRACFGRMLDVPKKVAPNSLSSYFTPNHTVSDWVFNVRRRFKEAELDQLQEGLRLICSAEECASHELMVFLLVHCLEWKASRVVRLFGGQTLSEMSHQLEVVFADCWEVEPERAHRCLAPLRHRLQMGTPRVTLLRECAQDWPHAAETELAHWRSKVLQAVRPLFDQSGPVLFAYQHKLLRAERPQPGNRS